MLESEHEASSSEVVAHRGADIIVRPLVSMQRSSRNPLAACPVDGTGRPQIVLGPGGRLGAPHHYVKPQRFSLSRSTRPYVDLNKAALRAIVEIQVWPGGILSGHGCDRSARDPRPHIGCAASEPARCRAASRRCGAQGQEPQGPYDLGYPLPLLIGRSEQGS